MYAYGMPTYSQAERVAWPELKLLVPKEWVAHNGISESKLTITTVFGSSLHIIGMDKPMRAEGVQWDGFVIDEACDHKPNSLNLSIMPALTHRDAWLWRIGVPKRVGASAREFKEFFDAGAAPGAATLDSSIELESYTWPSSSVLSPEKLRFFQEKLDAKDFAEQFGASWESAGGLVFFAYSDTMNVAEVQYRPDLPLLISSDFNTSPMSWTISQSSDVTLAPTQSKQVNELKVIDEIWLNDTNTQRTLDDLYRRYGTHRGGWMFFGDATAKARKTSASTSDYAQIRNDTRFKDARVFYLSSNPKRSDRFSSTNAMLCTSLGQRRTIIHPRCTHLRKDLLTRAYKVDADGVSNGEPNDYGDVGHMTDSLGYLCYKLAPPIIGVGKYVPQVGFAA